jgi:hypothetical protein
MVFAEHATDVAVDAFEEELIETSECIAIAAAQAAQEVRVALLGGRRTASCRVVDARIDAVTDALAERDRKIYGRRGVRADRVEAGGAEVDRVPVRSYR